MHLLMDAQLIQGKNIQIFVYIYIYNFSSVAMQLESHDHDKLTDFEIL